jgi:hypothetical protein
MEKWVKSTLEEAQDLRIPGIIQPKGKTDILTQYGLDRETLNKNGCKRENVNRLYRAFFVYSLGFYQILRTLVTD